MTREQSLYLRVGLLLIAGLLLGLGFVWFIGGPHIAQGERAESYFSESVQGLEIGAPVKYRGVTLGRVTDIGLVSAEYGNRPAPFSTPTYRLVYVRYLIDREKLGRGPDTQGAVRLGLRARLASQGLTGLAYLELDFVNPREFPAAEVPWQSLGTYIPAMPSTLMRVQDTALRVLAKLNSVDIEGLTGEMTGLLQDLRAQMREGDADKALRQITVLAQTMQNAVQAADLPALAADLRQTSHALRDVAQAPELHHALEQADHAATGLARTAAQLPPLIASLQRAADRTGDSTADLQQALAPLLRDIQATAQNLREITDALRRHPGQVFSAPPPHTPEHVQ